MSKLKELFIKFKCSNHIHSWEYLASYMRQCEHCGCTRGGWGEKHLNPGDDWENLRKMTGIVDPNDYRLTNRD